MERVSDEELEEQARDGRCHHRGAPFTGVAVARYPSGALMSEAEYRDGLQWGSYRRYGEDGGLLQEKVRVAGHLEGIQRVWHPNGRLACEEFCHFDFTLARVRWDPDGRQVEHFVLAEDAQQYQTLLRYREAFGRSGEPVPVPLELPTPEGHARG